MRYYASPINEDELVSDAFPMKRLEDIGALEFEGMYKEVEVDDGDSVSKQTVMDIPHYNDLQKLELSKAQFGAWVKKFIPVRKNQLEGEKQKERTQAKAIVSFFCGSVIFAIIARLWLCKPKGVCAAMQSGADCAYFSEIGKKSMRVRAPSFR